MWCQNCRVLYRGAKPCSPGRNVGLHESPPRRLAVTDACIKRASTRMPPTNFTAIDDDVDVDVDVSQNEDASGHRSR